MPRVIEPPRSLDCVPSRLRPHGTPLGMTRSFCNQTEPLPGTNPQERRAAVMTFAPDYQSFEVLDFDKQRRITGKRLP